MHTESTENLTAEQALDEALSAIFGTDVDPWREVLERVNAERVDDSVIINEVASIGYLRRWAAPLLAKEKG